MKRLFVLTILSVLCLGTAQAEDQVRATVVGSMFIRPVPSLTAATVNVRAADYTPKHGWAAGKFGVKQALEAMLINGYEKLARWMKEGGRPAGQSFVIYNQNPASAAPQSLTCKIGYPVSGEARGRHIAAIETLSATTAAVVKCQGSREDRAALRDSLEKWIYSRGYEPTGPLMEIYMNGTRFNGGEANDVAEIRWPVRRVAPAQEANAYPSETAK
jgi:effector-binding domain-containing protein